ncbi:MAG: endopeptidase La [Chloroflexota bacterium]|nr:endopeptidase La [Chloroflexota bacterium]MDQ5866317.1 endopeptidase La [Chloroflexota bacterium]
MPKKKTTPIAEDPFDELSNPFPGGNGHDELDDTGYDEPDLVLEQPRPRRKSRAQVDAQADIAQDEAATEEKPARAAKSRSRRGDDDGDGKIVKLPLLPLRDMVIFPHMVTSLFVGREKSIKAIDAALKGNRAIVAVAQRNPEDEDVAPEDLYTMGVELVIGRSLKMPDGTVSLLVQGQRRVRVTDFLRTEPYIRIQGEAIEDPEVENAAIEALMRAVLALFEKTVKLSRNLSEESYVAAMNVDEPGWLADLIASTVTLEHENRQKILDTVDPVERLQAVSIMLAKELDVLDLENRIHDRVQNEVDKSQREFYLREQMKAIAQELGDFDPTTREANDLRTRIEAAGMPEEVMKKAVEELERMQAMPMGMPEVGVIRTYIDWLLALPWANQTADYLDIRAAAEVLDANHYGLPKVKERILEYMAVRKLAQGKMRSPILCFVGPPGVGKTSLGRSIAEALGRRFVRVSLGGIRDEAEIRGHRRTYIGALPGRVIQTMKTAGTINPVFMLDEIDKLGADFRGDPSAALLEVLDPEQNNAFSDHYLDVPYNLSKVLFIMTANMLDPIPPALLDRMEVIELPGYIEDEKYHIARQFLAPRQIDEHGLTPAHLKITDGALRRLIREYTHEAGVRNLEREIGSICRKVAKKVAELMPDLPPETPAEAAVMDKPSTEQATEPLGHVNPDDLRAASAAIEAADAISQDDVSDMAPPAGEQTANGQKRLRARVIHERDLEEYLGPARYDYGQAEAEDEVGVATGVYWSPVGGDTIGVEVTLMEGRGTLMLTGQLGDVMKESAQAALSYARSRARQLGIDPARFEKTDIHIHVPAGAVPKDGPSAGVTMATALVSALTGRKVRRDVAMTGEITLRGKVLPIGGLKEKMLAAHRAGISTFVLPGKNKKDLADIPGKVLRQIQVVPVEDLDKVLDVALRPAPNLSDPATEPTPDTQPKSHMRPKAPTARRTGISGIPAS